MRFTVERYYRIRVKSEQGTWVTYRECETFCEALEIFNELDVPCRLIIQDVPLKSWEYDEVAFEHVYKAKG